MVFDVNMEDFKKGSPSGRRLNYLDAIYATYSSAVTYEVVCIALTMAALHDLGVRTANALNTYVIYPNTEKLWVVLGPDS